MPTRDIGSGPVLDALVWSSSVPLLECLHLLNAEPKGQDARSIIVLETNTLCVEFAKAYKTKIHTQFVHPMMQVSPHRAESHGLFSSTKTKQLKTPRFSINPIRIESINRKKKGSPSETKKQPFISSYIHPIIQINCRYPSPTRSPATENPSLINRLILKESTFEHAMWQPRSPFSALHTATKPMPARGTTRRAGT